MTMPYSLMNKGQILGSRFERSNGSNGGDCGPNVLTHANDSFWRKLTFTETARNGAYWSATVTGIGTA